MIRVLIIFSLLVMVGCQSRSGPTSQPYSPRAVELTENQFVQSVNSVCAIPTGWKAEPIKQSDQHMHQVWLSPSEKTAYGVICFPLPWPVSPDTVFPHMLQNMKENEGEATLLEKKKDESVNGIRFIVLTKLYKLRAILLTRGWQGWVVYAGVPRGETEAPDEIELAELARDRTRVGDKK